VAEARVLVVGLGSPRGEDAVGWEAVAALGPTPPGVEALIWRGAPAALLPRLVEAPALAVVDAVGEGLAPGEVAEVPPDRLRRAAAWSTHAAGLEELPALRAALGRRGPVLVLGIGVDPATCREGASCGPRARAAAALAASRLRAWWEGLGPEGPLRGAVERLGNGG